MHDLRPPRNSDTFTGRFSIPTGCKCMHCNEAIPWRTLGLIAGVLGLLLWVFYR